MLYGNWWNEIRNGWTIIWPNGEELHQPKDQNIGWKPDGTYNKKPLDPNYFKNYYQTNLETSIKCPDCGRTEEQQPANQTSQNTVKPTFVKTRDTDFENVKPFQEKWFLLNMFIHFVLHSSLTPNVFGHSIETLYAYQKGHSTFSRCFSNILSLFLW